MKIRANSSLPINLLLTAAFMLFSHATVLAQTTAARPDRGTMPTGSYSISDIENISLQNGNVGLSIPLAALPPIAGGKLDWVLKAQYNSKLWNITRTEAVGEAYQYRSYVIDTPQLSELGGWRIGGQYQLTIRYAQEDFDYQIPPEGVYSYADRQLLVNYNWHKVVLTTPDGAEHELRPIDYSPFPGTLSFLYGYYNPNPYQNGTMRYYSFDGSYLYAEVTSDNNWKVYMPDGTRIIQTTDGIQRIQDTNGNKINIFTDTNGTHYQDEQTGREIRYSYNPSGNGGLGQGQVWYQTVGGAWQHIDINFGTTYVQGQVYKVNDWVPYQFSTSPCQHHNEINQEIQVVREIVLPQTEPNVTPRRYTFSYNSDTTETASTPFVRWDCTSSSQTYVRTASKGWGALNQMVTPSGAVIKYSYSLDAWHSPFFVDDLAKESVTQKQVVHDSTTDTWTYSISDGGGSVTGPDIGTVTENSYPHNTGYGYAFGKAGLVYRTTRPFTRIERHWTGLIFNGAYTNSPNGPVDFNPVVDFEYTTLLDASNNPLKMAAKAFQYDYNGNVTQETVYDWFDPGLVSRDTNGVPTGVPAGATVLRVINHSYYNGATISTSGNVYAKRALGYGTPLILNAPQQTSNGSAVTQYGYDGQGYGVAPTVGNPTSKSLWVDLDSKWITSTQTYNSYGNLTTRTDPRGKVTYFYYDDLTYALPNRVVVDPQNGTGTQTLTTVFDYYTGSVTSQTDANGNTTTIDYTNQLLGSIDPFGRPGVTSSPVVSAGGTSQRHRTTTTYADSALQTIVATDLNSENDKLLKTRITSDVLGRVILKEQTEDGTNYTISSRKSYDQMGKITYASNPTRSNGASTDGWTRTTTDTLGRVIEVAKFSGSTQPPSTGTNANWTGTVSTSYDANFATITDQAGKVRRSMVDAIGRVIRLDEPDASNNLGATTSPVQPTYYAYDSRGNLLSVVQGVQTRTFTYDTLSRLRTATNSENGTSTYAYDDSSNLLTKQDARGIIMTLSYDGVNRPTSRTYSDGTPRVDFYYDSQTLPSGAPTFDRGYAKGQLVAITYGGGSAGTYRGYDARGNVVRQYQQTDSVNYLTEATYRLNGSMQSETYPSVIGYSDRRTVNYSYDYAGRLTTLTSAATTYAPGASVSSISYAAHSGLASQTYGNSLVHAVSYNSRLQPNEIKLGTSGAPTSVVYLVYSYGTTNNNGNIQSLTYSGGGLSYSQSFSYDSLNRLQTAQENSGSSWTQTNIYDRWGNRSIDVGGGAQSLYFNAQNRIVGYTYDNAGNLTYDMAHTYAYDAENRVKSVDGVANSYQYDGEGKRIKKYFPLGEHVKFIYGIGEELIAELDGTTGALKKEYIYGVSGLLATIEPTSVSSNGTRYTTADHLGSPRVVTNSGGSVVSRHDYMPFGEELYAGTGGRTAGMGFSVADNLRQKFTGYERDGETGLDYAGARYYNSNHGRFTTADPLLSSSSLLNPQSWNKYTYVNNRPLTRIDPSGLYDFGASLGGSATDDEIKNNVCAAAQCTEAEIKAGKRTAAEAQRILTERNNVRTAVKLLQNLIQLETHLRNLTTNEAARLTAAVNAVGTENDHNGVILESWTKNSDPSGFEIKHQGAITTIYLQEKQLGINFAFGLAHEGQHASDWNLFRQGKGSGLTQFDYEVRGFEIEGIAAKARGVAKFPTAGNTVADELLWNSAWKPADVDTLRRNGAMYSVPARNYKDPAGNPLTKTNTGWKWK